MKVIALVVSICLISAASPAAANRLRLIETTCKPQQLLALNGGNSLSVLHRAEPLILLLAEERGLAQLDAAGIAWRDLAVAPTDMRLYAVALDSAALSAAISWNPLARLSDGRIIVAAGEEELLPDGPGISKIRLPKRGRPLSVLMDPPYAGLRNRDYDPAIQALADGVTAGRLEQLLSSLVGFGTRYSTTVGCQQAVDWAAGFFQALGLDTETFPHTTGHAPNVLAWQTGMVNPDRIWILCGHIDSTSRDTTRQKCPGADDNGTGASLTMLAAELLHLHQFEDTILYALWTGEEQGLWGSSAWADYAAGQGMNIQACLNFDMVGWVEPAPEDLEVFVNPSSELLGQDFIAIGELYSTLPFSYRPEAIYGSDHNAFWDNGYLAFLGIEDYPLTYDYYHSIQDTLDKIDFPFFTETARVALAGLASFAVRLPGDVLVSGSSLDDCRGDGDGAADPGETLGLTLTLCNFSAMSVEEINVQLSAVSSAEWVELTDNHAYFGALPPSGTADNSSDPFSFVLSADTPEGTAITFDVAILASEYSHNQLFSLIVTGWNRACPEFRWTMDEHPGWTFSGQWAWGQPTGGGGSSGAPDPTAGYTGAEVVGYNLDGDYSHNMPAYSAIAGPLNFAGLYRPVLNFWRWLGSDSSKWDRAAIEASADGQSFAVVWESAGPTADSAWTPISLYLGTELENQPQVWLRWIMGPTNATVAYCGWNIDDVEICGQRLANATPTCTPTTAPATLTPTPASTATPVPTALNSPTPYPVCVHDGDVNGNGTITVEDAQLSFFLYLECEGHLPTAEQYCAADYCGHGPILPCDGAVTPGDSLAILKTYLLIPDPCE